MKATSRAGQGFFGPLSDCIRRQSGLIISELRDREESKINRGSLPKNIFEERGAEGERVSRSKADSDCSYLMSLLREIESEHPQICLGGAIAVAAAIVIIRNTQFDPIHLSPK